MLKNLFAGNVVVSDASCLIGLTNIGKLDVLRKLCGSVIIAPEVSAEYGEPLPDWITVREVSNKKLVAAIFEKLDLGESASIALAMETDNTILIIDELRARKYAESLKLNKIGTIGLLKLAEKHGIINDFNAAIAELKKTGFRLPKNL